MYKFIENFEKNLKVKEDTRNFLDDREEIYRFKFENNYGGSVIRLSGSDGYSQGLWELAVIKYDENDNWAIYYDTDVGYYVLGYLSEGEVCEYLERTKNLPVKT